MFWVIILFIGATSSVNASPPACHRNGVSMFMNSDAVIEAMVTKSRRVVRGGCNTPPGCQV